MLAQPAKPKAPAGDVELPPLSYVCTMAGDEDVIEDRPGKCRKCGMTLVPTRLDSVWTCATRPLLVVADKPGKCPVDGTALVRVTAAVSWTCKDDPTVDKLDPGTCADGSTMIKKYAARAHGNHNPQHGGQFFMAPDSWHHIEGTYLPTGVFRMHLYDDYTKPLTLKLAREISGTLVVKDPKTGEGQGNPTRAQRPVSAGGDWQAAVPGADVREGRLQARRSRHPLRFQLRRLLERTESRALGDDDHGDAGDVTGSDDAGRGHAARRLRQMSPRPWIRP